MKKVYALITALSFAFGYSFAVAGQVDSGPPAQQQKDNVPPSTQHGDYLEPQPDENNAAPSDQKADKKAKHRKDNSKPGNTNKGKNQTEQPDSGGVNVEQK